MRTNRYEVYGQFYLFPTVKVTHTRLLNGDIEVIFCWFKWEFAVQF
jgi:hypothetical protein